MRRLARTLLLSLLCASVAVSTQAQGNAAPDQSFPAALEAIQRARISTRILFITAHPDDENSGLLPYLSHALNADVALLTITRGQGGQNAIGPELGAQLGVIRSSELLAATQLYGVKLYFTRAPDFGFSKTLDETLRIWGDVALADMVRVIRTLRPNIIINGWDSVRGGHGNHQASGFLTPKAFELAADPKAFPDQIAEGLEPWQASLLLQPGRQDDANALVLQTDEISPTRGKSYREMGFEGIAQHRSQGVPGNLNSPFRRGTVTLARADGAKLDAAVLARGLGSIADLFPVFAATIRSPLADAEKSIEAARQAALALDYAAAARALARAGRQLMQAESQLVSQSAPNAAGVQRELSLARERIDAALAAVAAVRILTLASRPELVAGESFTVRADTRARAGVLDEMGKPSLVLPQGWSVSKEEADPNGGTRFTVDIPKDAKPPHGAADWMLPFPLPLVTARVRGTVEGYAFEAAAPVIAQRVSTTRVDTISPALIPAITLALEPRQILVREKQPPKAIEVLARVHYYGSAAAQIAVGLDIPAGWRVSVPPPLDFSAPGDQLARLTVTPPAKVPAASYSLAAWASRDGEKFRTTLEPLPSLLTHLWSQPAVATVIASDLTVPENLRVGYIAADNDEIPHALERLGIHLELLDSAALAFGDLNRFDAIVVGFRAYELRQDLMRANPRLLAYAEAGGNLVVLYHLSNSWDSRKPAPYPATMGQPQLRVTDEHSPVRFLLPDHPVLNFPNKITQEDFQGWIQDRALYCWGQWDSRYQPILALHDPGEADLPGCLLYARTGKGVYIYTSLAFFRQLPEGVPGAYRLFVNLVSQSRAKP
jgi:LmbE family N-acetylglucosaminyl deacetylase